MTQKQLFAADLLAVSSDTLSLPHEEVEKQLLAVGERLGLRGGAIDTLNAEALTKEAEKTTEAGIKDLSEMTLTVVDGDFPREVLGRQNLTFGAYRMPARRNNAEAYDAKIKRAGGMKQGILKLGHFGIEDVRAAQRIALIKRSAVWLLMGLSVVVAGIVIVRRRGR